MGSQSHWEHVYSTKSANETSWYQPHLHTSLDWISAAVPDHSSSIIDIGGGESTLADDLLALGYSNVTVLDIAKAPSRNPRLVSVTQRNKSTGSSPTSHKPRYQPTATTSGMIEQSFTSSPNQNSDGPMRTNSFRPSNPVDTP